MSKMMNMHRGREDKSIEKSGTHEARNRGKIIIKYIGQKKWD